MIDSVPVSAGVVLRPLRVADAPALLDAYLRSREHLAPFEPIRPDSFWTLDGQRTRIELMERQREEGTQLACALFRDDRLLGCATLNTIVRGPFRSASVGYWIAVDEIGRGLASDAVAALCRIADLQLDLHRLEASVLPSNLASQRVLAKNGFQQFGQAPTYLHINGDWHDSRLFQRILNDRPPGSRAG